MNTITCISYHQLQCEIEVGKNEVQDNKKNIIIPTILIKVVLIIMKSIL